MRWTLHFTASLALVSLLATPRGALGAAAPASPPAWSQRSFLVGGFCMGRDRIPVEDLVRLDAAGLDFLGDLDHAVDRRLVVTFAGRMDSLQRARPDFHMRALLYLKTTHPEPGEFTGNPDPDANQAALSALLGDPRFSGPGVGGWGLWDEPCQASDIAHAAALVRLVRALPATRAGFPYVSLFPIAPPGGGQCYEGYFGAGGDRPARYAAYLDAWLGAFDGDPQPAPMLAFDDYPFQSDSLSGEYFQCLRLAAERAAHFSRPGQRVPLWVVIQSSPWKPKGRDWYRNPSALQTRWQAWIAVAYGAKAIAYWTVGPSYHDFVGTGWGPGLIDFDGRPTARYASLAALDRTLHALGPTLMALDPVTVLHVAPGNQVGTRDQTLGAAEQAYGIVRAVTGPHPEDCTIGYLKHRVTGDDYLVVVNRSLDHANRFDLALDAPADSIARVDPLTGRPRTVARAATVLHVGPLAPADGALFRVAGRTLEHLPGVSEVHRAGDEAEYVLPRGVLRVNYATGERAWAGRATTPLDPAAVQTAEGVRRPHPAPGR